MAFSRLTKLALVSMVTSQEIADELERRMFTTTPATANAASVALQSMQTSGPQLQEIANRLSWDMGGTGAEGSRLAVKLNGMVKVLQAKANAAETEGVHASFTGQKPGMTTNVTIRANSSGVAGNTVALTFNGIVTISARIVTWNGANPTKLVSLISGSGSQVPDNGEEIDLSGGTADADLDLAPYKAAMGSDHMSSADYAILISAITSKDAADEFRAAYDAMVDAMQAVS